MPVVAIPKILRERLTDEGVDEFIAIIKEVDADARKDAIAIAEERFERRLTEEASRLDKRITEEISRLRVEMAEKFAQLETKMAQLETKIETKMSQLETKMETKMAQLEIKMTSFKAEIIKWMFLFWLGQIVVVAGLIKLLK